MTNKLRKLTLVTLKKRWTTDPMIQNSTFFSELPLIYLGEIPNMPEHGVFASYLSGRLFSGLHIFYFRELRDDEV